jgi:hypothetical protein
MNYKRAWLELKQQVADLEHKATRAYIESDEDDPSSWQKLGQSDAYETIGDLMAKADGIPPDEKTKELIHNHLGEILLAGPQ